MPRFGNAQYETTQKVLAAINAGKMTPDQANALLDNLSKLTQGMDSDEDTNNVQNPTH